GDAVQLTHDGIRKMGPLAFSPDGTRIAYTTDVDTTYSVPVLGGEPTRLLTNAGALSWIHSLDVGGRRVLFSAIAGQGTHMGVFTATESRADQRMVYLPGDENGMAHRAALSPNGQWVLLAEMDMTGWRPCRVVPFEGTSTVRPVGPMPSQCT